MLQGDPDDDEPLLTNPGKRALGYQDAPNLATHNERVVEDVRNGVESFRVLLLDKINTEYKEPVPLDSPTATSREAELVEFMNAWCCRIFLVGNQPMIALRMLDDSYSFEIKYVWRILEEANFRKLLHNLKLDYTKETQQSVRATETASAYQRVRTTTTKKAVCDIWLEHLAKYEVDSIKFVPGDERFYSNALNVWSGYAMSYANVKNFTDWRRISLLLNHLKFTWADNEEEYFQILRRFATCLVRPWMKTEVAMAVGGVCSLSLLIDTNIHIYVDFVL